MAKIYSSGNTLFIGSDVVSIDSGVLATAVTDTGYTDHVKVANTEGLIYVIAPYDEIFEEDGTTNWGTDVTTTVNNLNTLFGDNNPNNYADKDKLDQVTARLVTAEGDITTLDGRVDTAEADISDIEKAVQVDLSAGRGIFADDGKGNQKSYLKVADSQAIIQGGILTRINISEASPGSHSFTVAAGPAGSETEYEALELYGKTNAGTATLELKNGTALGFVNGSYATTFRTDTLTAARTIALPDASGTVALTSDIPSFVGYVDTTGTPANNQVAVFTDQDTIEGSTALIVDGANVGIGTTSPSEKLDVNGNIKGSLLYQGTQPSANFSSVGISTSNQVLAAGGVNIYNNVGVGHNPFIGFKSDGTNIQVWSNTTIATLGGPGGSTGTVLNINGGFFNPSSGTSDKKYLTVSPTLARGASYSGNVYGVYVQPSFNPVDSGSGEFYSAYFGGGNVGIGTTAPNSSLHVSTPGYATARFGSTNNAVQIRLNPAGGNYANLISDTTGPFYIDANTHVFRGETGGNERMRITSDGKVGIGTATPSEKLHVVGNGKFEGQLQVENTDGNLGITTNTTAVTGYGNTVIGVGSSITGGNESTVIGNLNSTSYNNTINIGRVNSTVGGASNIIIGKALKVTGASSIAMGYNQTVAGGSVSLSSGDLGGNAVGILSNAVVSNSIGIGYASSASNGYAVAIGLGANTSSGNGAIAIGHPAKAINAGVSIGFRAGQNSSGVDNILIGTQTGYNASAGLSASNCIAIGQQALRGEATASGTIAVGYQALTALTTGTSNTAVGYQAASSVVGQGNITAIGYAAGQNATTPHSVFVGTNAGQNYTSGDQVVAIGYNAASISAGGQHSIYVGGNAGAQAAGAERNVAIGQSAGYFLGGHENTLLGGSAGAGSGSSTFSQTVAVGYQALTNLTTGAGNTAVGHESQKYNTTGTQNTSLGYLSLQDLTTGNWNNAFGHSALQDVTSGTNNIGIGAGAGRLITSGQQNLVIGRESGAALTNQRGNTFLGFTAGQYIVGQNNVAIGRSTMVGSSGNSTVDNTVAIGYQALTALTTGASNTAIGYQAGNNILAGAQNTLVGYNATIANQNGAYNVIVGDSVATSTGGNYATRVGSIGAVGNAAVSIGYGAGSTSGNNVVAIGYNAGKGSGGTSNSFIGTSAGEVSAGSNSVGVGYLSNRWTTGGNNVAIGNEALLGDNTSTFSNTTAVGYQALTALTTGTGNTAVGYQAGKTVISGVNNTLIGFGTDLNNATNSNCTIVGANTSAHVNAANQTGFGYGVRTGNQGTSVGSIAGNQASTNQSALGYRAGEWASGMDGTQIGKFAGRFTTGAYNTLLGSGAGQGVFSTSSFSNTVAIGYQAGTALTTGGSNILIGYQAGSTLTTESNKLYIENSNSTTPLIYGEFDNDIVRVNGDFKVRLPGESYDSLSVGETIVLKPSDNSSVPNANYAAVYIDRDGSTSTDVVALHIGDKLKIKRNGGGTPSFVADNAGFIYTQNYDTNDVSNANPFNNGAGFGARGNLGAIFALSATNGRPAIFGALNSPGASLLFGNPAGYSRPGGAGPYYNTRDTHSTYFFNSANFQVDFGGKTVDGDFRKTVFQLRTAGRANSRSHDANGSLIGSVPTLEISTNNGDVYVTDGSTTVSCALANKTMRGHVLPGMVVYIADDLDNLFISTGASYVKYTIASVDYVNHTFELTTAYSGTTGIANAWIQDKVLKVEGFDGHEIATFYGNDILRVNGEIQVGDPTGTGFKLPTTDGTADQVLSTDGSGVVTWVDTTLEGLSNVVSALTNNEILTYNSTLGYWVGGNSVTLNSVNTNNLTVNSSATFSSAISAPSFLLTSDGESEISVGVLSDDLALKSAGNVRVLLDKDNNETGQKFLVEDPSSTERFSVDDAGVATFNNAYSLPNTDGTSGQVLTTNGSGAASWADAGGGKSSSASGYLEIKSDSMTQLFVGPTNGIFAADYTTGNNDNQSYSHNGTAPTAGTSTISKYPYYVRGGLLDVHHDISTISFNARLRDVSQNAASCEYWVCIWHLSGGAAETFTSQTWTAAAVGTGTFGASSVNTLLSKVVATASGLSISAGDSLWITFGWVDQPAGTPDIPVNWSINMNE